MSLPRRSLILGASLGAVAPSLVRAETLIGVPGDPLTKHGLAAASVWATEEYREIPGSRLVFASGHKYKWHTYQHLSRRMPNQQIDYAVAIETCVTDAQGRRTIHSVPIDAVGVEAMIRDHQSMAQTSARSIFFMT